MELLGIEVVGTPDTSRLILPENWPAGVYPMRKSFKGLEKE
jgi:Ni,Fe-hydrogenase III component G